MAAIVEARGVASADGNEVGRMLGRLGVEVRCGELIGRAVVQPDGLWVRTDPFFGGEPPPEGLVIDVHWRVGAARYVGWAPVVERGVRGGVLIGPIRKTRRVGTVRELPYNLLFVDPRPGTPVTEVHRVVYADPDWMRISVPGWLEPDRGDVWHGHLRKGPESVRVSAQVRGGHADGTRRLVLLRWRPEAG